MQNRKIHAPTLFLLVSLLTVQVAFAQNIYTKNTWKERDKWQQVPKILKTMGISEGDVIADIGCHEGYMTFKFVDKVGKSGKVYAVDVNKSRLRTLDGILKDKGIDNVETVHGDYDNPNLKHGSLDYVFIMDAYHEMESYKDMLRHIKAALKDDGRLVILEPIADEHRTYSRERQMDKHDISLHYVINDLKKAGFKIVLQQDKFINRAPKKKDHLWILIASLSEDL